jgi:hypothetical protein
MDNTREDRKQNNMQWFLIGLITGAAGYYIYDTYYKPKPVISSDPVPKPQTPDRAYPMVEERPMLLQRPTAGGCGCGTGGNASGIVIYNGGANPAYGLAGVKYRLG